MYAWNVKITWAARSIYIKHTYSPSPIYCKNTGMCMCVCVWNACACVWFGKIAWAFALCVLVHECELYWFLGMHTPHIQSSIYATELYTIIWITCTEYGPNWNSIRIPNEKTQQQHFTFLLSFTQTHNRLWSTSDRAKRTITTIMSSTKLCIAIYNRCCSQRRSLHNHHRHRNKAQNGN